MRVLIVDDESVIRELTQEILLSEADMPEEDIQVAVNGQEGLEVFKDFKPDLVITDMMMPVMNGAEMIERIREIKKDVDIIVMTGYADLDMAVTSIKMGVNEMIRKPFKPLELVVAVNRIKETIELKIKNTRYEEKLVESEKLSSIGLMAAGIAHEINNPNTFIKGNLELLQRYFKILQPYLKDLSEKEGPDQKKIKAIADSCSDTILSAINGSFRIAKIVQGLLSFSRQGARSQGEIDFLELLDEALVLVTHRIKRHELIKNIPENIPKVVANPQKVVQALMNLVVNACDAMEERLEKEGRAEKGILTIALSPSDRPGYLSVHIIDDGIGMDERTMKKMFDPFFTTKPVGKGTGLGMSITLNNLRECYGDLECKSEYGKGTTFTMLLPYKEKYDQLLSESQSS